MTVMVLSTTTSNKSALSVTTHKQAHPVNKEHTSVKAAHSSATPSHSKRYVMEKMTTVMDRLTTSLPNNVHTQAPHTHKTSAVAKPASSSVNKEK